jgi:uncharacterized DUF497 family protein
MRLEPPLIWEQAVVRKLWEKHRVEPGEVEEVFFDDRPLFKRHGEIYHAYGQTVAGRYLFVVFRYLGGGKAKPITAYEMTEKQRRYYRRLRGEGGK